MNVLDFMNKLIDEDPELKKYQEQYGSLIKWENDFDWLNSLRDEHIVLPPIEELSYSELNQLSKDVGGELLITPLKKYSVVMPYGLHEEVKKKAEMQGKTTEQYLLGLLLFALKQDNAGDE